MLCSVQHQRFLLFQRNPRLLFPPLNSISPRALHSSQSQTLAPQQGQQQSLKPQISQILSIRHSLLSRELSAVEIAESYLSRIRDTEPRVRSFLHLAEEESVIRQAQELDAKIGRNEDVGPLAGVLVGVKDNICTVDMPSTGGSRVLEGYRPPFDATAVERVKDWGGIVVGKTNLDEFGMGSSTEGSAFQVTTNPWDEARVPGGSSGGSAAAVSARQCVVSLGSDTGGSVRQPASFCGVVGLKPTYGRVSRYGLMAYASSLDVIGCFGSTVADAGMLLHAISGHDRLDATSNKQEVPDFTSPFKSMNSFESKPLKGLRVGLIRETVEDGVDQEIISSIRLAASHLEDLGCSVTEVSLPSFSLGLPAYYILASSESSSNLARYDGIRYGNQIPADELASLYGDSRANGFGSEVKMRILMGTYALSAGYYDAYYKRAQQVRTLVQKSFKAALANNDILISPAAPSAAYKIGEKKNDPLSMYAGDIMTVNVNLAGLPALVLPCGFVEGGPAGLPVGLQMIGSAFDEEMLLKVGRVFKSFPSNYGRMALAILGVVCLPCVSGQTNMTVASNATVNAMDKKVESFLAVVQAMKGLCSWNGLLHLGVFLVCMITLYNLATIFKAVSVQIAKCLPRKFCKDPEASTREQANVGNGNVEPGGGADNGKC